ncbi:MAG TPA: hypothetical protein VMO00_07515 [Methylomirabilota bacterium]|nr:hypothetical protein [Methylomirabilota bacterium]
MSFSAGKAARDLGFYLFLCILLRPSLSAAEIIIEPRVGFHGVFQLGHPFPLEIELTNTGRPAEGILDVRVWKGGASKAGAPYALYSRKEVFLPGQSKKSVEFTVDPDFISRPLTITFSSETARGTRDVDLRRHFSPAPVMLLVSEGDTVPPVFLASSSQNRLVSLLLAELPADSRALLGVSHLMLYDQSLRELSRSQLLALDTWIISGGRMIILGSINYALYQEPNLSRFLPVHVTGITRIASLPQLIEGKRASPLTDVWAQTSTLVEGKVLTEAQGTPLIVESSRGKGKITYLSFDIGRPPLSHWNGLPTLFRSLLAPAVESDARPRTQWDDAVFSQLIVSPSFISTYVPSGSLFGAILAYLAGIGFFAWLWQKKRLPSRTLLLCFAGFVMVFTVVGYVLFSRGGNIPDGILLSSTVLENVAPGYVEAQANVALFSTQIRQYDVHLERGWLDLIPVSSRAREREQSAFMNQDGGDSGRFQLPFKEWDYRLFKARFVERFPFSVEFEQRGDKLLMSVNSRSADLTDCWLVVSGQRHSLGDIQRGARWTKEFSLAANAGPEESSPVRADPMGLRDISFKDKTRDILFHSSFFPRDGDVTRWGSGAVIFLGWVKEQNRRVWVDDPRIWTYNYTLFRTVYLLASEEDA